MARCTCGKCHAISKLLNQKKVVCHAPTHVVDDVLHEVQAAVTPPAGNGMSLSINFGDKYLVRFLVPSEPGSGHGKYSEGQDADYGTALAAAVVGLSA